MTKSLKKIWDIISTVIVAAVVILALLLVGVRLFGFKVFTVLSGSMEPAFHTGSLIYVKTVDYTELKAGDPITFMLDEKTIATHRIVAVIPDNEDPSVLRFQTKGDANEAIDGGLVYYKNVIGVPVFSIPYLGYVANYIQNPPGLYISIAFGAVLLLLVFLPDLIGDDDKKDKKSIRADEESEDVDSEANVFEDNPDDGFTVPEEEKPVKPKKRISKKARQVEADDFAAVEKPMTGEAPDETMDMDTPAMEPAEKELTEMDLLNAELEEILGKRN